MRYKRTGYKNITTKDGMYTIVKHWTGGYMIFCNENDCLIARGEDIEIFGRQKDAKRYIERYLY